MLAAPPVDGGGQSGTNPTPDYTSQLDEIVSLLSRIGVDEVNDFNNNFHVIHQVTYGDLLIASMLLLILVTIIGKWVWEGLK
ncbi:hypothetical protein [Brevibacillus sp. SYSU BS000544]|uniref:hypothetical protein n=1 Tax=Brevibacillus sp. SYSU BS000544 TaxID=3416443 RepID=UPI003CE555AF